MNTPRWYALRVRSNHEKVVQAALQGRGYEEFLPVYRKRSRWSDRTKQIDVPLFPGYVFSRFVAERRLPVLTIPSVVQIVGNAGVPAPVDDDELDAVRRFVTSSLPVEPWPYLRVGETVVVDQGALAGTQGIVVRFNGGVRLVVSVSLLQRSVALELDRSWVRPAIPDADLIAVAMEQFRAGRGRTAGA